MSEQYQKDLMMAWENLRRIIRVVQSDKKLQETPYLLLMEFENIAQGQAVPISALRKYLNVTPAAATIMIRKLEKHGLVERETPLSDRRVSLIRTSEKGRKELAEAYGYLSEFFIGLGNELGESNAKELVRLLQLVSQYVQKAQF